MKTYTIYEIPGVKIGCTDNLNRRQKAQRNKGELIILESYTCIDRASEREQELQRSNGYPVDKHSYKYMVQVMQAKSCTTEAIKKRVENTDFKRLGELTSKRQKGKPVPYLHTPEVIAKRIANTDYKAIVANRDNKGAQSHRQRRVVAISPEGKRTIYPGITEAARQLTKKTGIKFYQGSISNVCNPNFQQNTSRGYRFEYSNK
jgi:hypothetical protein